MSSFKAVRFVAVITDPRPGHDFGKQHHFNYDYSYWSLTVSTHVIFVGFFVIYLAC